VTDTGLQLGQIGAWFNPRYDDDTRTEFVIQAEKLGYPTAWLGVGRASISDLSLVERVLDETATITVATAIVNMWTNDPADIAESYQRIAARHGDRFLLGIGIGHPESITSYRQPYATMVDYPVTGDPKFQASRNGAGTGDRSRAGGGFGVDGVDGPAGCAELAGDVARGFADVVVERRGRGPFRGLQHDCDGADSDAGCVEDGGGETGLTKHGFVVFGRDPGAGDLGEVLGQSCRVDDGFAGHAAKR
jgi:hypothetical protein